MNRDIHVQPLGGGEGEDRLVYLPSQAVFPKGRFFEEITLRQKKRVQGLLNRRPRKILRYAAPTEVFFGSLLGENFALQG
jgi:hypothetical protein